MRVTQPKFAFLDPALRNYVVVLSLMLVAGCATTPATMQFESTAAESSIVWPQSPEVPRLQYVGQLTGEENFPRNRAEESAPLRFLKWVAGVISGSRIPNVLQRPQGVTVDSAGRIIVTDVSKAAVCVFDSVGGEFKTYSFAAENTPFQSPIATVIDANGDILVTDSQLREVFHLSITGEPKGRFGAGILSHPTGIARDPKTGNIYVADTRAHAIKVFAADGTFIREFGVRGEGEGQFNAPTHLSFQRGVLVVADTLNSRVQQFTANGEFLSAFGERGIVVGNMPRPKGVAMAENGLIYVVESYYDHLLVFDTKGEFLLPIGGTGQMPGQFYLPAGVWVDGHSRVYVADMFNGRVVVLKFLGGEA